MKKLTSLIGRSPMLIVLLMMVLAVACSGAEGAQGPQGPSGPAGPQGAQGPAGEAGYVISESSLLDGLAPGAVFPFIDTTPNKIQRAHIAVTDAAASCAGGDSPPTNVQVLVGEAGVALEPVMSAATNTGISTTPGQCVFHVTIKPGQGVVPATVTDIVVLNGGGAPLTGINTITVSAEVR